MSPESTVVGLLFMKIGETKINKNRSKKAMRASELVKMISKVLKAMSENGLRAGDYEYVEMYEEYVVMRSMGEKFEYVINILSDRYRISESTVKRIIRRFEKEVRI